MEEMEGMKGEDGWKRKDEFTRMEIWCHAV